MQRTKIPYIDYSWNPIAMQCTPIATGCKNCWSIAMNKRFRNKPETPELIEKELDAPLRLRKPARIGVQFMGDLFHEKVERLSIGRVLNVIGHNPEHTFLMLTKRIELAAEVLPLYYRIFEGCEDKPQIPYPNLWHGFSASTQPELDRMAPIAMQIPAAVRFVSLEPLLGDIDLEEYLTPLGAETCMRGDSHRNGECDCRQESLDWVIVGCERLAGNRAGRFCEDEDKWWAACHDIAGQCNEAGVSFYMKQGPINGKVVDDINRFPKELQKREYPE